MSNTLAIVTIMILAGIFGGLVNFFTIYNQKQVASNRNFWGAILAGIAASFLVPLFLSMISSDLIVNSRQDDKYYFVFAGLCLIAGIFSRRFINSIGKRILDQVEKVKEKTTVVEEKNIEQDSIIRLLNNVLLNHNEFIDHNKTDNDGNRNIQ